MNSSFRRVCRSVRKYEIWENLVIGEKKSISESDKSQNKQ